KYRLLSALKIKTALHTQGCKKLFGSDHPDWHDKVLPVQSTELRFHTDDCTSTAGNRSLIQKRKHTVQFRAGSRRLFDFNGIQNAVVFQNDVNFPRILVAVIVEIWFFAAVEIGFGNL